MLHLAALGLSRACVSPTVSVWTVSFGTVSFATVSLRTTTMTIYRTEEGGGSFVAPLAVNARITFIPVKPARTKSARPLQSPYSSEMWHSRDLAHA